MVQSPATTKKKKTRFIGGVCLVIDHAYGICLCHHFFSFVMSYIIDINRIFLCHL